MSAEEDGIWENWEFAELRRNFKEAIWDELKIRFLKVINEWCPIGTKDQH